MLLLRRFALSKPICKWSNHTGLPLLPTLYSCAPTCFTLRRLLVDGDVIYLAVPFTCSRFIPCRQHWFVKIDLIYDVEITEHFVSRPTRSRSIHAGQHDVGFRAEPMRLKKLHGTEASCWLCKVVSQTYPANHCRPTPRALDLLWVSYVRWVGLPRNTSKRAKQPNVALFPVLLSEKEQIAFSAVAAPLRARFRSS